MNQPTSRYAVVTGTDTSVGKTIVTAALAVALEAEGNRVAVVKPVQTGVAPDEPGDIETIVALTGLTSVHELARLELPLAPESAARAMDVPLPTIAEHVEIIRSIEADIVLIEGAGGLLVRLDLHGGTIRDLAKQLDADVVLVAREELGTLNHIALTLASLAEVGLTSQVVLGSCSDTPNLATNSNRSDIPRLTGAALLGLIPEHAGSLTAVQFRSRAAGWFTPLSKLPACAYDARSLNSSNDD
jgi:dethiobiotin synthetase